MSKCKNKMNGDKKFFDKRYIEMDGSKKLFGKRYNGMDGNENFFWKQDVWEAEK